MDSLAIYYITIPNLERSQERRRILLESYMHTQRTLSVILYSQLLVGSPPGREGTGFPGRDPVPSGNRDGTEWFISRPVVPTGKGREGTRNAKKYQEIKNYFKGNN